MRLPKHANKTSQVPVKNLSDYDIDMSSLKYGLHHSFINKNKFMKRDLAVEFESLATTVDETGTCYYKTGKVIAQYLKPLTKNEFVINNTQDFPSMLNRVELSEDEEDVSYDVESLFTNIPINETIDFICDEIYIHKKIQPIGKFKKLKHLIKMETQKIVNLLNSSGNEDQKFATKKMVCY